MTALVTFVNILAISIWCFYTAEIHGVPMTKKLNNRPIIAVLSQEITPGLLPPRIQGASYIAASYVQFVESAGARVVPVTTTMTKQEVERIFNSVNGVLFPGGNAALYYSQYFANAKHFYNLATKANMQGDYFPIWGTCLGFEALACLAADKFVLSPSDSVDIALQLNLAKDANESRMLKDVPKHLRKKMIKKEITYNYHRLCVTPDTFFAIKALNETFRIVSYNNDLDGKKFISTIEGRKLPFYGTQWHPEMNTFAWNDRRNIPHSKGAVQVTQYFANFFVGEARKSQHRFVSKVMEDKYLIYRYRPVFTGDGGHFAESYIFN